MNASAVVPRALALAQRHKPWLLAALLLLIATLLFEALRGLMAELRYDQVIAFVRATAPQDLLLALAATAVSFAALSGYDRSALRYAGAPLPWRVVGPTSFIAFALANTVGLGVLTGGAVRMRLYGAAGAEAGQISTAIAFNAAAFGLGLGTVGAAALLWGAPTVAPALHLPVWLLQGASLALLLAMAALLWRCASGRDLRLRAFGARRLRLPAAGLALQQLLFSALDIIATAAVLWVLLPDSDLGFAAFVAFFAIATVLGVLSHVPGGLGVFETVMLVGLRGQVPAEALAGALVMYRVIYYLLPLALALALLVVQELRRGAGAPVARAAESLSPLLLAAFTFVVGLGLLVSGVTPATDEATDLLALHVPLVLVEASHFLGSVAGVALLFVARGMLLRLDAAWWAGLLITAASLVLCLPKGIALTEAALLAFLVLALAASRRQFTRRASLIAQPFSGGWMLSVALVLAALYALLLFVYRDVQYAHELWWQFEFDGHAPRALRALVAVALIVLVLALRQLLRTPAARLALPDAAALARADDIVRAQDSAQACLALMGDKHLLFSASGAAFVMFGRRGRSWVALYDPVGAPQERDELVWTFMEQARAQGGRGSFYQVRPQHLPIYLDAGLRLYKLGEEAFVPLADFSLQGSTRARLRQGVSRAEREGLSFEMIEPVQVPAAMDELRVISDAWLGAHRAAEKGFSLGAFDPAYVQRQGVALIRHQGRAVAFATLMLTTQRTEASVDLMRQLPDAPKSAMEFLFVRLMLHFKEQGFARFGLGMAPLAGMAAHALAPQWHRLGRLLFQHGEPFYNFRGLRAFKEKFDPVWEARYLAAPGGAAPLMVLTDVAALVAGGLRGIISK